MSVVRNEYEIGENHPGQALDKAVIGAAILAHPYHWSTIGYRSDIEGVTTEKLREHYKNFFWANNSEAILVGDFDAERALVMFNQQFGGFQKSPTPIPRVITQEPQQEGERRVVVRRSGSIGLIELAYMRPNSLHPDFIPLDVLTNILGAGVNSRLYQALVEKGLATSAEVSNPTLRDPYPIVMVATVAPGIPHQQVEDSLKAALYRVGREGITEEELARAKEQIEVAVVRSRDGTYAYASSLGEAVASASWKWFLGYIDAVKAVTREDVQRVAATYLVPDYATVGWFIPETAAPKPQASAPPVPATKTPAASQAVKKASEKPQVIPAAPTGAKFASRTVHRVLGNGIVLDLMENHAVPTVAIQGAILAGDAVVPQGKPALAQLTALMIDRGTTRRTKQEIAQLLDNAGANLTFGANTFQTTISGSLLSRDVRLVLEILAEELQYPAFNAEEFARAKTELKSNVLRASENTSLRALERMTQRVLADGHPYRAPGRERMVASIEALAWEDLSSFHKTFYNGSSLILSIVGDIDAGKTADLVEELFEAIQREASWNPERPTHGIVGRAPGGGHDAGQSQHDLMYGHASGLRRNDADYEASLIANAAVGQNAMTSRIGKRVRDVEGLCTASHHGLVRRISWMDRYVNVAVAPVNLEKALRSTREEFEKYCKEGITAEELETQKTFFAGNYRVNLGSNAGVAAALVTAERFGYGPSYLDEFPERMRKVTKEEVNAAIRKHMHPDSLFLVVAGDLTKLPASP